MIFISLIVRFDKLYHLLISTAVILLSAFVLFYKLGTAGICIWDEAIYANNALEIAMNGDWFVMKVDGRSNLYNTKPPLMIWLQAICIKIWGAHAWSIRLPSAIAALGVVFSLLAFGKRSLGDIRIGWLAILVLISSTGYVRYHVSRTGDLDSLLSFFICGLSLLFFHFLLHQPSKKSKWFIALSLLGLLAYMTKSTAALIPFPGLLLGSLYKGRIVGILKTRSFYLSLISSLLVIISYYAYRESLLSGYCLKVWQSEFLRFTDNIMPWHTKPASFYIKKLFSQTYFYPFAYLVPLIPILFFTPLKNRGQSTFDQKHFTFLLVVFVISFLAILSYPSTKIGWYLAPLYPILSLGLAFFLARTMDYLGSLSTIRFKTISNIGLGIISIIILAFPYQEVIKQINDTAPRADQEYAAASLSAIKEKLPALKKFDLVMISEKKRHLDHARFYATAMTHYEGYELRIVSDIEQIDTTQTFLICYKRDKEYLSVLHTKEVDFGQCSLHFIED